MEADITTSFHMTKMDVHYTSGRALGMVMEVVMVSVKSLGGGYTGEDRVCGYPGLPFHLTE